MSRKEKDSRKAAGRIWTTHGKGSYDIELNLEAWMDRIRALLIEDDQTLDEMAAQVRFGRTERSNRRKVGEVLKRLAREGEAESYGDEYTQETWRLTLMGRLRQIKGEEMFNSICEANYVRMLIEEYGAGGEGAASSDDYPPVAVMTYVAEEDTGPGKMKTREGSPDIELLTVDKRKCWCTGGELRECIIIPEDMGADTLKRDISKGAYPFEPLAKATPPDLRSKVVFIRVKKIEYGYKAAVYFAALQNELDGMRQADCSYIDKDSFCLETWDPAETGLVPNIMPIVPAGSMIGYQLNAGIDMGVFGGAGLPQANVKTPYWKYHRGPIIIIEPEAFFMNDDTLKDSIGSVVNNNSHVYVICVERENFLSEGDPEDDIPLGTSAYLRSLVAYDAAAFDIAPEDDTEYFDRLLSAMCNRYGLSIPPGYPRKELISRLGRAAEDMRAEFLDGLISREANRNSGKELRLDMMKLLGRLTTDSPGNLRGWDLINSLQGMEQQKKEIRMLINGIKFSKARRKKGLKSENTVAVMFAGAPGTAKSTVARAVAEIMANEELLPDSSFISVTGSGLQAEFVGMTSGKVRNIVSSHSTIFIDEAYSLSTSAKLRSPYAEEAMSELLVLLEEAQQKGNKLFIFAGYGGSGSSGEQNRMKEFLESNPGLKSRISCIIDFKSYSPAETTDVFMKICANNGYSFMEDEIPKLRDEVERYFMDRADDALYGNGREARTLCAQAMSVAASRIMEGRRIDDVTDEELKHLTAEDVLEAIKMMRRMEQTREGTDERKISLINCN